MNHLPIHPNFVAPHQAAVALVLVLFRIFASMWATLENDLIKHRKNREVNTHISHRSTSTIEGNWSISECSAVAKRFDTRYRLPVTANSVTGLHNPNTKRPHMRPISIAGAFFVPAMSFYGGCVWDTFGCAGVLFARFVNPHTAATYSLHNERGSSPQKGAVPMMFTRTQNPSLKSATLGKAAAHRAMAMAALHADSSLSVRLKRYDAHMAIARTLETTGGAL